MAKLLRKARLTFKYFLYGIGNRASAILTGDLPDFIKSSLVAVVFILIMVVIAFFGVIGLIIASPYSLFLLAKVVLKILRIDWTKAERLASRELKD